MPPRELTKSNGQVGLMARETVKRIYAVGNVHNDNEGNI